MSVQNIEFTNALSERYLSYALSTIMARSLPDVRDGLKPVHRRLLYAMLQLKLNPDAAYKKCARVVGDVIGKYHPHGDIAVYDTLVRLAQNFSLRYPLIDGQGNFGSIDGDNAAAMRYTESRMTEICTFLMANIDQDTVDFRPTYDDSDLEPVLMPAMFPNLLANGSEGIAVGMATSIPSHNLHELCDAMLHIIDNPKATVLDILEFVQGPDFPTGGVIIDDANSIKQSYTIGRGSFKVRARFHTEAIKGDNYKIIINEIPYQVLKSKILEQIAALLKDKKLPLINNIRDESAEEIRIVIETKASYPAEAVMESLFKFTNLESRIQLNMNVIGANQVPRVMNLLEVLQEFLAHRQNIITRKSKFLITKIEHRLEILQGLKIAYLNIDEIISIIREEDEPKQIMIDKFNLTDIQAEAILNIRLRSLRKLDEYEIINEYNNLQKQHAELTEVLANPKQLWKIVKSEIKTLQSKFGISTTLGKRRTSFSEPSNIPAIIDLNTILREPVTIFCSKMGWIRCLKGHNHDLSTIKYKEGDAEQFILEVYSTDKVIFCSTEGRVFTIAANTIYQGKGHGEAIKLIVDIGNHSITNMFTYTPDQQILLASSSGKGFIVMSNDLLAQTRLGKQIMTLADNHQCIACIPVTGDTVACTGSNRKLLIFSLNEIPIMKRGHGVVLQKFKDALLTDITVFDATSGLSWRHNNKIKTEKDLINWRAKRSSSGKLPPAGFPKDGKAFTIT
ncbi:DNA topoisomerase IV subunit A [Candidatus Trichorickettsia mobilis]|uniref:DNA topoisomerase 4 subunit A n=1 Tax=Candidatus Trichorickettsia mobilis TaxID=1346319 RepID=A0ABZ0UQE1_9RICK|nr:DNA topoisomerase IV subunit A [Candidatus Trichorickettsia mobilis]WPY00258.1 DNA topoisomerase IV subunit A [Candidatus Trichorickettsia mobilis]